MDNITIKENIRKRRDLLGITQEEAANLMGLSLTGYRDIEVGSTQIVKDNLDKIAEALDISPEELLLGYRPFPSESMRLEEVQAEYGGKVKKYEDRITELERRISDLEKIIKSQDEVIETKNEVIAMLKKSK